MTVHEPSLPDPAVNPTALTGLPAEVGGLSTAIGALNEEVRVLNTRIAGLKSANTVIIAVVGLMVLIGAYVSYLGVSSANEAACAARQYDAVVKNITSARNTRDRQDNQFVAQLDSQIALFNKVLDPNSSPTERAAASADYKSNVAAERDAVVASMKAREDNPLPAVNCS